MNKNKGLQLGAVLAVMLLIAVAFVGVAAPNKEIKNFPKDLPERIILGLNDSQLQDKEIPDFGPEVFERMKKEPKVLETRGKIPRFETQKERKDWLDKLDSNRIGVRNEIRPYLYPNGPIIIYGWDHEGYFEVILYENATVNAFQIDEIYAIISKQAKKIGILDAPLVFKTGDFIHETLTGYEDSYRPVIGGVQIAANGSLGTSGFAVQDYSGRKGYVVSKHIANKANMQVFQPTQISGNEAGTVLTIGGSNADASFVSFDNVEASIHLGGGLKAPVKGSVDPQVGWTVYKSGRTTGVTSGTVIGFYDIPRGGTTYYNQVKASFYSDGGDSGSPVWYLDGASNRKIVGIQWGKDASGNSYFSKSSGVKSDLGVIILTS
ncbi:MAG: hypothetical protein WA144_05585 [Candidatus Methanoperedens sp.]